MTLKASIILLLFFVGQNSQGQTNLLEKKELLKVFKASIRQDYRPSIITNSNPWVICNEDSSYYKSDTLTLFPNSNNYPKCKCGCFIEWTFYKKDAFILTTENTGEPRRISVAKVTDWYKIKLQKKNNNLILETYNQNLLIERFKVLAIDKALILTRLKANL